MESSGGALHFDADIDNRKYLMKIIQMEDRIELFAQNVVKSNESVRKSFDRMASGISSGKVDSSIAGIENRLRSFESNANRSTTSVGNSFDQLSARLGNGNINRGLGTFESRMASLGRSAAQGTGQAGRSFQDLAATTDQSTSLMSQSITKVTATIAGFLSVQAAAGFVSKIIDVRSEFEKLDVSLTTILKSKQKADALTAEVVEFAANTPFGLTETTTATKQLLAYGVGAGEVIDELKTLGNVAAGVSQPIGEIAYLYGTLKTQGRAYAMDIRQFTGRGIPIIAELGKVLGVAKNEVMGLVESGKVGFPEVQKAFQNMTGSGGAFFDLMQKQSLTTGGRISNLKDQIEVLFNEIGKSNSGIINSGIAGAATLVQNYDTIVDSLGLLIAVYGAYRAALALTAAVNKLNIEATNAKIAALNLEIETQVRGVAVQQQVALQSEINAGRTLTEAEAKAVNAAATEILAAQEQLSVLRKTESIIASELLTAQQALETASKNGASAATITEMEAEVALLTVRQSEAAQMATNAAGELRIVEARAINSAATVRLTAMEVLRSVGLGIAAKAQAVYNAVLAASPMVAAVAGAVGLGYAIYALTQANNTASEAQERINGLQEDATIKRAVETAKIKDYVKIAKDASNSDEDRAKAIKKLNDLNPEFLKGLNLANISTQEGTKLINEYLRSLEKKALGELAYAEKSANTRKIIELQTKGQDALSNSEILGTGLKNFFTGKVGLGGSKEISDLLVKQKVEALTAANKEIDTRYGGLIKEFQLKGLATDDAAPTKGGPRTEGIVKAEIKALEELKDGYDIHSKEYAKYTKDIKKLNDELASANGKVSAQEKKDINERLSALKAIEKAETASKQRALSDTDEKLQKAKDDAANLRKVALAAGLGAGAIDRIDKVEKTNTGTIQYEQDTVLLNKEIDRQKGIFAKYEQYKLEISDSAAKERYANEKADYDSFADYLQSNITPLYDKAQGTGLTGSEQDRLNKLLEIQKNYGIERREVENKQYGDALLAAETVGEKIKRIQIQYANIALTLGKSATNERKESLLRERDIAINAAKDEALQKTAIYKKLSEDILVYTQAEAKEREKGLTSLLKTTKLPPAVRARISNALDDLQLNLKLGIDQANLNTLKKRYSDLLDELNAVDDKGDSIISPEQAKRIVADLDEIQQHIDQIDRNGDGVASYGDKVASNFDYMKKGTKELAEGVSKDLGAVSGSFNELSQALGGNETQAGYLLDTFAQMAKVGSDAAGSVAAFSSGDIIGGVTKGVSAIAGVFSLGKKVKEMNEKARAEMQKYYDDAAAGEIEYQSLLRDRERQVLKLNELSLKGIADETAALNKQKKQIDDDYQSTLKRLQNVENGQITGSTYKKGNLFKKAKTTYSYAGLQGLDYTALEELYTTNKLTDGAKALFEELQKLKEEGADVEQALVDAAAAASELATGTTVENLSSNIISNLRAGKIGLQDVMDDYTKIIQDALLSTFQSDVVDVEMKKFYERLSLLAQSNGELTPEEIDSAKADYLETRKKIQEQFDALSKITGVDLTDSASNTSSGITASVKSLTQDTGVAIEGLLRGLYDYVKRGADLNSQNSVTLAKQLEYMGLSLDVQIATRDNTATLVLRADNQLLKMDVMLNNLNDIVTNTKPAKTSRDLGGGDL